MTHLALAGCWARQGGLHALLPLSSINYLRDDVDIVISHMQSQPRKKRFFTDFRESRLCSEEEEAAVSVNVNPSASSP